jgi:hypothetical protein
VGGATSARAARPPSTLLRGAHPSLLVVPRPATRAVRQRSSATTSSVEAPCPASPGLVNIHPTTLSAYSLGHEPVPAQHLTALGQVLGVPEDELVGEFGQR